MLQRIIMAVHGDVHVVRVQWLEYNSPDIGVLDRSDFDLMVEKFGLSVGEPYGDYRTPRIAATGVIGGLHVTVSGPLNPRY